MDWFSFISYDYRAKNKLDEAVTTYLNSVNRQVITIQPDTFKKTVLENIERLNQENPRCKPIHASWMYVRDGDYLLSGVSVVTFYLYASKFKD